jgi:RsiW-degrading membrane proteinase PrsW (M82 family)
MAPAGQRAVLDSRRFGRTPLPFIAALAAISLIALVALIIVLQGSQLSALIGLVLALIPVPLVLAGVLYLDRLEPEPLSLLVLVFGAGAGAAALIGLAGHTLRTGLITTPELGPQAGRLMTTTLGAAFGGALVAETLKGAVLVALLRYRRAELDGAHDAVVYASMTGLGFALIANLFAYSRAEHSGLDALVTAFAQRGVLAPLWDPLFSSMVGLGVSYAAMRRGRSGLWAVGLGWVVAVALHTMWDDSVNAGPAQLALVYLILVGVLAVLLIAVVTDRRRIVGLISGYLPEFSAAGVATEPDIEMLGSLHWRRQARDWARLHRGLYGQRAMSEYQLAATELALAANRAGRGLMPQATFEGRREDSLALMRAALPVLRDDPQRLQPPPWAPHGGSAFTPHRDPPRATTKQ